MDLRKKVEAYGFSVIFFSSTYFLQVKSEPYCW